MKYFARKEAGSNRFEHVHEVPDEIAALCDAAPTPAEGEAIGKHYLSTVHGIPESRFVRTSYSASVRGKFAGIGDEHDEVNDVILSPIPAKPFPSWLPDGRGGKAPIDKPVDLPEEVAEWDEQFQKWMDRGKRVDPTTWVLSFTEAERQTMLTSPDPKVQEIVAKQKKAPYIRKDSPVTIGSVDYLTTCGILTEARRAELLA